MPRQDVGACGAPITRADASTQQPPTLDMRCGTCGTTCATERALAEHLVNAYHGFQCLRCGALLAQRRHLDEHTCRRYQVPHRNDDVVLAP